MCPHDRNSQSQQPAENVFQHLAWDFYQVFLYQKQWLNKEYLHQKPSTTTTLGPAYINVSDNNSCRANL